MEETEHSLMLIEESPAIRHYTDNFISPGKDVSKFSNSNLKKFFQQPPPPDNIQKRERINSDKSDLSANHKKAPKFVKAESK